MSPAGALQAAAPSAGGRKLPRAFHPGWAPPWIAFIAYQWWAEIARQLAAALPDQAPRLEAHAAAALGAAGHLAGSAIEALFYAAWWRAHGAPLRFRRLFVWLVSISVLDLLASALARVAEAHPGWVSATLEVFVGFGVIRGDGPGPGSGFRAAFGPVGLLCVARLLATAEVQRRGTGRGFAAPLALTFAVWLMARFASWWMFDLARGMSALP